MILKKVEVAECTPPNSQSVTVIPARFEKICISPNYACDEAGLNRI